VAEFFEGPSMEPNEKISTDVKEVASKALAEIKNIQLAGPEDISTEGITDLKVWMRDEIQNSPEPTENIVKIMRALKDTGFAMDDEIASVREKIVDITMLLDQFITNPNDFKVKNPDLTQKLVNFCEKLSSF